MWIANLMHKYRFKVRTKNTKPQVTTSVNQTCIERTFPHLKLTDFKFGGCSVDSDTATSLNINASCFDKSGSDPIVYNGTVETSVQYNTNDMMVHVGRTILIFVTSISE